MGSFPLSLTNHTDFDGLFHNYCDILGVNQRQHCEARRTLPRPKWRETESGLKLAWFCVVWWEVHDMRNVNDI